MLFNSPVFIFAFLPAVLCVYCLLGQRHSSLSSPTISKIWLVISSLFFYGWWKPRHIVIIIFSICLNYCFGKKLVAETERKKIWLIVGITCNLLLLGYFKYAKFIVEAISALSGFHPHVRTSGLPLAISFFTFQSIAYLVDSYRGHAGKNDILSFSLFMTFFPQLIAGPIVYHKEVLPQYADSKTYCLRSDNFAAGITIFCLGLFKKVVMADTFALYATPIFTSAAHGETIFMSVAWVGAIAYSLQLYYDFSGYSDMAIGLARIFNIHLPVNFNSPYKSLSIIEFWARWHITLSQFLRNYLYIPLGGNRKGEPRRLINIFITMLLGGIWHGAGTQFILWGILHGFFIVVNHIWRIWKARLGITPKGNRFTCFVSWVSTMLCVVIAWVFFRADNIASALLLIKSMFDPGAAGMVFHFHDVGIKKVIFLILGLLGVGSVIFLPNTQELMAAPSNLPSPSFSKRAGIRWRPSRFTGILIGLCFFFSICILLANRIVLQTSSPFLYFKF